MTKYFREEELRKYLLRPCDVPVGEGRVLFIISQTALENLPTVQAIGIDKLKEIAEGLKSEIRYEELDTGIGIDRLEFAGQELEKNRNQALSDLIKAVEGYCKKEVKE